MKFTMTAPCDNCPFRKNGFVPLSASRVREIAGGLLNGQTVFPCHKTVEWGDEDEDGEEVDVNRDTQQHCAGAFIFCEKHQRPTQMMRISERLREYDHTKLTQRSSVFDNVKQMQAAHRKALSR